MKEIRQLTLKRANDSKKVEKCWEKFDMPCVDNRSFLDVGCWSGGFLVEALRRGADRVLGIDMVDNIEFKEVNLNGKADFLLMDIMPPLL